MKKKVLSILLTCVMVFSLAACGNNTNTTGNSSGQGEQTTTTPAGNDSQTQTTTPVSDEPITINVMQWALDNQTTDFENLWFYQQLEADTNVNVNWTVVKESEWNQTLNLTFASADLPDVIIRPNQNLNIEDWGVDQGLLIPLDDYLEEHMPNYYSRVGLNNLEEIMRSSDGKMYYLGYLIAQNINHEAHFFMNNTWLEMVGKEVPATVDELTDVLRAFRDQQPGASGMYPMSAGGGINHHIEGIYTYFGMFGVPLQRWTYAVIQDNDKIVFPGHLPGFREACEWLAMCYAEGLLDPDAITQDENSWNAKVNGDQVGFQTYLRLINSAWANPDTIENWISILPPAGSQGATVPRLLEIPEFGAVLTVANKHIPETLRWLDAQFETERMLTAFNGPTNADDIHLLGEDAQDIDEDGTLDAPLKLENGVWKVTYTPANDALYKIVPVAQGQFFAPGDYYFDIFELPPHRIERMSYAIKYQTAGVVEKNSYMILSRLLKPTPDDATDLQRLHADLETLMRENIANFIISGVTDDTWNKFLADAENIGVNKYTEIYQGYYDAYIQAVR
ncbi:MAG: extracellular solute-binding protein [Lachnospiraceae bacterium]|nr:extracellular solute-binding protein [Lachnospiraceae bacterium]